MKNSILTHLAETDFILNYLLIFQIKKKKLIAVTDSYILRRPQLFLTILYNDKNRDISSNFHGLLGNYKLYKTHCSKFNIKEASDNVGKFHTYLKCRI